MAAASSTVALPGIVALPPTTARQIGSGQVLVDASSVVKELIDNALDARAKSIFVDVAANTIDTIQVKDDGHGIPNEDRPLVCRRNCTSEIRDLHDLKDVGGRWLGFRGEALSSMAEMSGALMVATRVEGESVAVRLKYSRDGELALTERDSHPVGTTVKVTGLFEYIPVRKQAAIRNAAKCLAKIRRLIQAYVLARPGIRFRLHVLRAKNNAGDFVYAPKADASVEDAVLKIFGKECSMQCGSAAVESDGYEIHAFLPKPTAIGSKISNHGSFVSVDTRPVSSQRGTIKQLVRACKDRLSQVNASLAGIRDPFLCMDIDCPPGSYDANVEPAKDDMLFENSDAVLRALDKLLKSYYPDTMANIDNDELSWSPQNLELEADKALAPDENNILPQGDDTSHQHEDMESRPQARWRTSMYGIDEDDLEFLQDDRAPVIDEEEDRRAIEISNPWTIARMNAAIKPRQSTTNRQLPSPAKSTKDVNGHFSPSKVPVTPNRIMTPQTSSKTNMMRSPLDDELQRSIQHRPKPSSVTLSVDDGPEEHRRDPLSDNRSSDSLEPEPPGSVLRSKIREPDNWKSSSAHEGTMDLEMAAPVDRTTHPQQPTRTPKLSKPPLHQKGTANPELLYSQADTPFGSRRNLQVTAGQTGNNFLHSNNKDIRDCFRRSSEVQATNLTQERSFTPINWPAQSIPSRMPSLLAPVDRNRHPQDVQDALCADSARRPNIRDYLQTYSERAGARSFSPTESQISMQFNQQPSTTRQFPIYKGNSATSPAFHAPTANTKRLSLASPQSNATPATRKKSRVNLRSKSVDQMNAYFQSHLENAPAQPSRRLPHTVPSLEKSHHTITTENLGLTKPNTRLKPPSHNLTLKTRTNITVQTIIRQALTRHDRLPKWDCVAEEAYHSFGEHIPEKRIAVWVCKLDSLLCELYERVGGMRETRGMLAEGVRRALGEKGQGVDAGHGGEEDQEYGGLDDVVAEDDGDEYDDDIEEEMLMDL